MDILNPADLKSLITQQGKWCVSLYMPTHSSGREVQQDPIRLKNLLARAEANLLANGLRRPKVQELMQPAEELLWDKNFWQHQSEGLALFLTHGFFANYRLPSGFDELLLITKNFHTKPLVPLLNRVGKFYLLFVNLKNMRLFQATADTIHEVALRFPTSLEILLGMDEQEDLNVHSGATSTSKEKGRPSLFHGQPAGEADKTHIRRFFRTINEKLDHFLEDKNLPMILAGVDSLLSIYREASSYEHILEAGLFGNPEQEELKELHQRAHQLVKPVFEAHHQTAREKFEQFSGQENGLATSDLETAVKAATSGQVDTLFVPLHEQIWGRYDAENHRVLLAPEPGPNREDLLDRAAAETILNSGQVFAVPREQLPGNGDLAAIFRFALAE